MEKLKQSSSSFTKIFDSNARESALAESDTLFQSPVALLFQTGYLTIKGYDPASEKYSLGIPNREVERSLFPFLLSRFINSDSVSSEELVEQLKAFLQKGEAELFLKSLKSYIADVPTFPAEEKVDEKYFEHTLYLIFRSMGFRVFSQKPTSISCSDLIVSTSDFIYIFELKTKGTAKDALRQINDKEYDLPFVHSGKTIFKIGILFSSQKRNISS